MAHSKSDKRFPTTDWSIVANVGAEPAAALTQLVGMYRLALLTYLERDRGLPPRTRRRFSRGFWLIESLKAVSSNERTPREADSARSSWWP